MKAAQSLFRCTIGRVVTILLSAGLLFSASCGKKDAASSQKTGRSDNAVVITLGSDVDALNPVISTFTDSGDITDLMLLYLIEYDDHFRIRTTDRRPCLAESWRFADDYLSLSLTLRPDVRWSDGTPVTAKDVKFTYQKLIDPIVGYKNSHSFDFVKDCVIVSDYEVEFHFKEVYASMLDDINFQPLPQHVFGEISGSEFLNHPYKDNPSIVNGQFRFEKWVHGQQIELVQNANYSLKKPHIERIIFKIIPEMTIRLSNLNSGDVDIVRNLRPEDVESIKKTTSHVYILSYPSMSFDFISWYGKDPLFNSVKIRNAMTLAINRPQIVGTLLQGYGQECIGPVHPSHEDIYNPNLKPLPYAPDSAKAILAEAGWQDGNGDGILERDGQKFEFTLKTSLSDPTRTDAVTMIQADLKKIGVNVILERVETAVLLEQLEQGQFQAALSGYRMGVVNDPSVIWHSKAIQDGFNVFQYASPTVDSLIDLGRKTLDKDAARKIWYHFQEALYADQPATFMFVRYNLDVVNKRVQGIRTWPFGIYYDVCDWTIQSPDQL